MIFLEGNLFGILLPGVPQTPAIDTSKMTPGRKILVESGNKFVPKTESLEEVKTR